MRTHVQRRDFLKLGAAGLTAAGAGSLLAAPAARAVATPAEDDFGYVQFGVTPSSYLRDFESFPDEEGA